MFRIPQMLRITAPPIPIVSAFHLQRTESFHEVNYVFKPPPFRAPIDWT